MDAPTPESPAVGQFPATGQFNTFLPADKPEPGTLPQAPIVGYNRRTSQNQEVCRVQHE